MARKKKYEPLSRFEEDLLYMSCRYCVGRNSIGSHAHAQNVASAFYERMLHTNVERLIFNGMDINREIASILRFHDFYINVSRYDELYQSGAVKYGALDLLYNFIVKNDETFDSLKNYKSISVEDFDENYEPIYKYKLSEENKQFKIDFSITDLVAWQSLANLFNVNQHVKVHTYYRKRYKDIEAFITWQEITVDDNSSRTVKRVVAPVEKLRLENTRIDEQYIEYIIQ